MEQEYKRAFSRLKASPEKIQEVINMTENRRPRKVVRRLLVAAVVMALAMLIAVGANAASGGQLFRILSYHEYDEGDGSYRAEMEIELDDEALADGRIGEFGITQDENGKTIMTYTDEDGNTHTQILDDSQLEQFENPAD